ncbi:MAG: hypothetical protein K2P99_07005 [Burkholderiales bacterium]|nr:hypothetical protein [Burkholderiales bacterium]
MINKFKKLPNEIKKSFADQVKLLSWVLGGVNGFFINSFGKFGGVIFIIVWWLVFQYLAHYIIFTTINDKGVTK